MWREPAPNREQVDCLVTLSKIRSMARASGRALGSLFPGILAFRLVNALLVQTHFEPDEAWQCLEPAHLLAFGIGAHPSIARAPACS